MKIAVLVISLMIAGVWWTVQYEQDHPVICVQTETVAEILELRYRDAKIRMNNGEEIWVNQATLKPGDSMCIKHERK